MGTFWSRIRGIYYMCREGARKFPALWLEAWEYQNFRILTYILVVVFTSLVYASMIWNF